MFVIENSFFFHCFSLSVVKHENSKQSLEYVAKATRYKNNYNICMKYFLQTPGQEKHVLLAYHAKHAKDGLKDRRSIGEKKFPALHQPKHLIQYWAQFWLVYTANNILIRLLLSESPAWGHCQFLHHFKKWPITIHS